MHTGTYLRLRGHVFYFHRRIPQDVVPHYGNGKATLVSFSLHTSIQRVAMRKAREHAVRLDQEFQAIRLGLLTQARMGSRGDAQATASASGSEFVPQPLTLTPASMQELCDRWKASVLMSDEYNRITGFRDIDSEEVSAGILDTLPMFRQAISTGRHEVIEPALQSWLWVNGYQVDIQDPAYLQLRWQFLQTAYQAQQLIWQRQQGELVDIAQHLPTSQRAACKIREVEINLMPVSGTGLDTSAAFVSDTNVSAAYRPGATPGSPVPVPEGVAAAVLSLDGMYQQWLNQSKDRAKSTLDYMPTLIADMEAFFSKESIADVRLIRRGKMMAFTDHLLAKQQHYRTVEKKMALICAMFQVAMEREQLVTNPASRIKVAKPKVVMPSREPFNQEDLQRIFNARIYHGDIPKAGAGQAAPWLPALALYTGARLEELAQLSVHDLKHDPQHGYYLNITDVSDVEDEHRKQLKTESSRRRIPLHPDLIQAGLITYWTQCKEQGHRQLFPHLVTDIKGKRSGNWSKWWSRYLRHDIGITASSKVFHSFRHTFKDVCREAGIGEEIHDALTGHAGGGVGRHYGSGQYPLGPLVKAVRSLAFGVALAKLAG